MFNHIDTSIDISSNVWNKKYHSDEKDRKTDPHLILLGLSIMGFIFTNLMIKKEEKYLYSVHGEVYMQYKKRVPRYIII